MDFTNLPLYNVSIEKCKFAQDNPVLGIFLCFSHKFKWGDLYDIRRIYIRKY